MTDSNSFSSAEQVNPPASGAESTSVNSQNDVSMGKNPDVNLDGSNVNSYSRVTPSETENTVIPGNVRLPQAVPLGTYPEDGGHDRDEIERFIDELCYNAPGLVQTVRSEGKDKFPRFHTTDPDGLGEAVRRLDNLSRACQENTHLYIQVTTCRENPNAATDQPEHGMFGRKRGGIDNTSHLLCLWNDIDFGDIGHAERTDGLKNPPDAETAHQIYVNSGLPEASVIVNSGGGLYEIVLLDEPFDLTDEANKQRAISVCKRWQQLIEKTAKEMGYFYSAGVSNLDRILRVPGTVNTKQWDNKRRATAVYNEDDGGIPRYSFGQLEALINDLYPEPVAPVQPNGQPYQVDRWAGHGAELPGNDFNARGDWQRDILDRAGFVYSHAQGNVTYWGRPGKDIRKGHGFSLNHKPDLLFAFTDGTTLKPWRYYDKFSAFAHLFHGGNFKEAAAALRGMGYGSQLPATPAAPIPTPRTEEPAAPARDNHVAAGGDGEDGGGNGTGEGRTNPDENAALPFVDITNERDGLHNIVDAIESGWIPELYVRDGKLVHVGVVSGARNGRRRQAGAAEERQAPDMNASQLRALLAKHTITIAHTKGGTVAKLPSESLCKAVLASNYWRKVPDLVEITPMPFVREDGTVCQKQGYDDDTGVWLNVDDGFPEVPAVPSRQDIEEAKSLLVNQILRDFPFVTTADRSNYLGLLFTPALSRMIGSLSPFGVITAASAGSGKSLLAELISNTYGGNGETSTLPRQDEEIRKLITSKLMSDPHKVITFDNVGKTYTVDSPVLAQLLTSVTWSDRALGGNDIVSRLNDRLWLATGNNVRLGGDMASRSVFVRIDPKMERPDKRDTSQFALGDLQAWMRDKDNRVRVMHALLVLIRAWAADGAPRIKAEMRSFTTWAQVVGGLLNYHGLTGFLDNVAEVDDADDESYEWAQFLSAWHARHGDEWLTTAQLLASYKETSFAVLSGAVDPWNGAFPVKDNGQAYTPHQIGGKFKHIQDRPFMGWVLRRTVNKSTNQRLWRPERMDMVEEPRPEQLSLTERN